VTSSKPYLLRAIYQWLVDNKLTPHLLVDASVPRVHVPDRFIEDNQIILNISPNAVRHLDISNDDIRFAARFAGVVYQIVVPVAAVKSIYAFENGRGMLFDDEEIEDDDGDLPPPTPPQGSQQGKGRPHLKVIK